MGKRIKAVVYGAVGLAVLAALLGWGYFQALKYSLIRYNEYDTRSEGMLNVGDLAPDLELTAADGTTVRRISEFYRQDPLVLVFGSYT